jgi:hypothetical protein
VARPDARGVAVSSGGGAAGSPACAPLGTAQNHPAGFVSFVSVAVFFVFLD